MTPVDKQLAPPGGWIVPPGAPGPRIAAMTKAQMHWWERLLVWVMLKAKRRLSANAEFPLVFQVLMRNRRLFYPWVRFAARLMPGGKLGRRDTELVILRVGWNSRCRYEWGQHVEIAQLAGLSAEQVHRVSQGPQAEGWAPHQAALLQAVDELFADKVISSATWATLAGRYSTEQLIELTLLIGSYQMLAGALNSLAIPLDASVEEALGRSEIHRFGPSQA